MAAPDFGTDSNGLSGLQYRRTLVSGTRNVGNALGRRLSTRRATLRYAPNYGLDLKESLNSDFTRAEITSLQGAIEQECEKDERVLSASATVVYIDQTSTLEVTIEGTTEEGPFTLVLGISQATVEILRLT